MRFVYPFKLRHSLPALLFLIVPISAQVLVDFRGYNIPSGATLRTATTTTSTSKTWNFGTDDASLLWASTESQSKIYGGLFQDSSDQNDAALRPDDPWSANYEPDRFVWYLDNRRGGVAGPSRGVGLLLWRNSNFLNGFAGTTVAFDRTTTIALGMRNCDYLTLRFVIRNGTQYYISEASYDGVLPIQLSDFNNNGASGKRWGTFSPSATSFGLPATLPTFVAVDFTNVTEIGFVFDSYRSEYGHTVRFDRFSVAGVKDNMTSWSNSANVYVNTSATGAATAGNVTGFPLLIRLNRSTFDGFAATKAGGADLRFTKADGVTPLAFEIARWVDVGGDNDTAEIWVRMDTVYANQSAQRIRMWWGNSAAASKSFGPAVFNSSNGYAAVYHLNESAAGKGTWYCYRDATGSGYDGVDSVGTATRKSMIGPALFIDDWTGDFIDVPEFTDRAFQALTVSFWSWGHGGWSSVAGNYLQTGAPTEYSGFKMRKSWDNGQGLEIGGGGSKRQIYNDGYGTVRDSVWTLVSATYDGSAMRLWYNDSLINSNSAGSALPVAGNDRHLNIGRNGGSGDDYFMGAVSELEFSTVARERDWVKLASRTQQIAQSVVTIEQRKPGPLSYAVNPAVYVQGTAITPNVCTNGGGLPDNVTVSPSLPAGLQIDRVTGAITGTPSATAAQTAYTVKFSNSIGADSVTLTITVNPRKPGPLTYAVNPATYYVGVDIAGNAVANTGGTPDTFVVSPALPAGLSLDGRTGAISGRPAAPSAARAYVVTARNATGADSVALQLAVVGPPGPISYPRDTIVLFVGTAITGMSCSNAGGTADSFTVSPTPPSGIAVTKATGALTGTPLEASPRTAYTVTARNPAGSASTVVQISVVAAPRITYARQVINATVNTAITADTCRNSGGAIDTFTVDKPLPAGLTLDPRTGLISGTPTAVAASAVYTVTARNAAGTSSVTLTIAVSLPLPGPLQYAVNPATYVQNRQIMPNGCTNRGGPADSFTVAPPLVRGLVLNSATGEIAGTPQDTTAGVLQYTVTARNSAGTATVVVSISVVKPGTIINPYSVKGRRIDGGRIELTISNFENVPATQDLLNPWTDSLSVWYRTGGFGSRTPDRADVNQIKFAIAGLQAGPKPFVATLAVTPLPPSAAGGYYYLKVSSYWHNPDSIPWFVFANGDSVLMTDTAAPANPLSIAGSHSGAPGDTTATISIGNTDSLSGLLHDSVTVRCSFFEDLSAPFAVLRIKADTLKAAARSGVYRWTVHNSRLSGLPDTVYCSVIILATNGKLSQTKTALFAVGRPLPANPITRLSAAALNASQIRLSWQPTTGYDSIRIAYGASTVPTGIQDIGQPWVYLKPRAGDTSFTAQGLNELTAYYFCAQVFTEGFWTVGTSASSASAATLKAETAQVRNTIAIDSASFDPVTNRIGVWWHCDTAVADTLEYGASWGLADTLPSSGVQPSQAARITARRNSIWLDLGAGIRFDTLYRVQLWMRKFNGAWAAPTDSSQRTVRTSGYTWQAIEYFKDSTDRVLAFNNHVVLYPPADRGWQGGLIPDTLRVFAAPPETQGLVPVSAGITFQAGQASPPFYIGLRYDAIPVGYAAADIALYGYSAADRKWVVFRSTVADTGVRMVTLLVAPSQSPILERSFILMIDTAAPAVALTDTSAVVPAEVPVIMPMTVRDNVANVTVTLRHNHGGAALLERVDTLSLSAGIDSAFTVAIPGASVQAADGLRAFLVIDDGRNRQTFNVSRRVRRTSWVEMVTEADQWVPMHTTANLDDTASRHVLMQFLDKGGAWEYDNTRFRLFRWHETAANAAAESKWTEYAENTAALFGLTPGRLMWLKTLQSRSVDFGPGITPSLKDTFTIELPSRRWTDVSLPFNFGIRVGDIIDATRAVPRDIQVYQWKREGRQYSTAALYLADIGGVGIDDKTRILTADPQDGYSIFNNSASTVTLRIPPTCHPMSTQTFTGAGTAKRASAGEWTLQVRGTLDDGTALGPLYCGYARGAGERTLYPASPSFLQAGIRVYDRASGRSYGHAIAHRGSPGCCFELRFFNDGDREQSIAVSVEGLERLPHDAEVMLVDPATTTLQSASGMPKVTVPARGEVFRMLTVGGASFGQDMLANRGQWQFSVVNTYPNPVRGAMTVRYTVPYTGVDRVDFSLVDGQGRLVWHQSCARLQPGPHNAVWDGKDARGRGASSGSYHLRIRALDGNGTVVKRVEKRVVYLPQ